MKTLSKNTEQSRMRPKYGRHNLGRARYSPGYVVLTANNEWQGHWFPYVIDQKTGKEKRAHRSTILGTKAKMRKYEAEALLREIVFPAKQKRVAPADVTFGWFVENRWVPMREGDWRSSTKQTNNELLAILVTRFGATTLSELDAVAMQGWINDQAAVRSQSRVWHLRTFLKSICDEAVEQDFVAKDPARKLKRPRTTGPDETVLEWSEYHAVLLDLERRDRLVVKVAGACAVRPGELFAFRWRSLQRLANGRFALLVSETVYRGTLRTFAKTKGSLSLVAVPTLLAAELQDWRAESRYSGEDDFIFPNTHGGFISKENYLTRVLYPVKHRLKLKMLNFQVLRRTFATRAYGEGKGTLKDVQNHLRHAKPDMSLESYIKSLPETVSAMVDSIYESMIAEPKGPVQ